MLSFSGTRGVGLDNEPEFVNKTWDEHMTELDVVTPLQADASASELRHHPNQTSASDDLPPFPGTRDIMLNREPDYVNTTWDYNTPDLNVVTPLKADAFASELKYHPDQAFVEQLLKGISEGFEIGYLGPECSRESPNLKSARDNPEVVSAYLQKECNLGRVGGPCTVPPFPNMQCHPIGVVPKKEPGKFRTILHLSYPPGDSINDFIPKDEYSLHYITVDKAISAIKRFGRGAWLSKLDIEAAFRIIPVHPSQWHLLGMKWKGNYYFDKVLSMGGRSSPSIFDGVSSAIEWICTTNYLIDVLMHLLDDFLSVEPPYKEPNALKLLIEIFERLGVPLAPHKIFGPAQVLEFLGIILDTLQMEARLSAEKIEKLQVVISSLQRRRKCTKRELLSLIGSLSFATRVVVPGRPFLSWLIKLSCTAKKLEHFVYLNQGVREDLVMWTEFLRHWNGRSFFLEDHLTAAPDFELYTDASGAHGYGAYYQGQWFRGDWEPSQLLGLNSETSIAYQELFPIVVAACVWGHTWQQKRIMFHCDNEATVNCINKGGSSSPLIAKLLRLLTLKAMFGNFVVRAAHVPGKTNCIADALSRKQIAKFFSLVPGACRQPTEIPKEVLKSLMP